MQRSVEQRQMPKRRVTARRHPRAQVLGFTARQWPFIFVLVGNWVFACAVFALAKFLWDWVPTDWTLGDRIALEVFIGAMIRDNLTLNVLMFVWPLDSVLQWQQGR